MTKKSSLSDEDMAEFMREHDDLVAAHEQRIAQIVARLQASPAITGSYYGGKRHLAIVSGEIADREYGDLRVTFFGPDGPHGHNTHRTMAKAAEEIERSFQPPYVSLSDAEVIAWTSTPEFEHGSRVIAFVQAENTLRYLAGRADRNEWARGVIAEANEIGTVGGEVPRGSLASIDKAVDHLARALRELPTPNPSRAFVRNPAWVTGVLASSYETIADQVPAKWLPQLMGVRKTRGKELRAELTEFGCGAYGCVLATQDPKVVLKVTSDESEAGFAVEYASLATAVCVEYTTVIRLSKIHQGRMVHLLWREAAAHVGKLLETIASRTERQLVAVLLDDQHKAGQELYTGIAASRGAHALRPALRHWLDAVSAMDEAPLLRPLSKGLLEAHRTHGLVFCDLHAGNLGLVTRSDGAHWVITDPGHAAIFHG